MSTADKRKPVDVCGAFKHQLSIITAVHHWFLLLWKVLQDCLL